MLAPERMIPLLPCRSIDEQVAFYEAIGFEVTYRQKAPNAYAAVRRGAIELHFFAMKGYDPGASYSTCYVLVTGIDRLYEAFRAGLKASLGRVPTRGIPRIGTLRDMSYGVRQFLMTDPGGNIIRIGQALETDVPAPARGRSRLEKALEAASTLADSKLDPPMAARVLDDALAVAGDAPARLLVGARILRADVAVAMGDDVMAKSMLDAAEETKLAADDRMALADDLARAQDLRRTLA